MSRIVEEMMKENEEKVTVSTWINDAKKMMNHFKVSAEQAINVLEIPDSYQDVVLAALK